MAVKTVSAVTPTVSTVKPFAARIEPTVSREVQRHLRMIYQNLYNHARATEYMAQTAQATTSATASVAGSGATSLNPLSEPHGLNAAVGVQPLGHSYKQVLPKRIAMLPGQSARGRLRYRF